MRAVALLAAYNEERFVAGCIGHLTQQGLCVYLIDNESSDRTVEIAERYLGRGLVGIETFPRDGFYPWQALLRRKAELATAVPADWYLHVDADEIRLPSRRGRTLAQALAEVDRAGYNAVTFQEFTFVPTREQPDHDHSRYAETMRWYYAFRPRFPDRLNAWKRQDGPVDLATSGGHVVSFPGLRMYPEPFPMRHYLFLSLEHAIRKYVQRVYDPREVVQGMHRRRAALRAEDIELVPQNELRRYTSDNLLDASRPRTEHPLFAQVQLS